VGAHRDPAWRESQLGRIFASTRLAIFFGLPAWMSLSRRIAASTSVEMVLTSAVRRQFFRRGSRRSKGEYESRGLESVAHGIQILSMSIELAPGLLTTLCQEHSFHIGCGDFFLRLPSHQRNGAADQAPGNTRIAARTRPPLRKVRKKLRTTDPRGSSTGTFDGASGSLRPGRVFRRKGPPDDERFVDIQDVFHGALPE